MKKKQKRLAVNRQSVKKLAGHDLSKVGGAAASPRPCEGGNDDGAGITDPYVAPVDNYQIVYVGGIRYKRYADGRLVRYF
jgi:hypothetical protein